MVTSLSFMRVHKQQIEDGFGSVCLGSIDELSKRHPTVEVGVEKFEQIVGLLGRPVQTIWFPQLVD